MKIDIWSDVRCPFCYVGKRKFENALEQFAHKDKVEIEWHSFELDPTVVTDTSKNVYDYLAEIKGQSREWSVKMHEHVTKSAAEVGLHYDFDKAVIANSFDAHRLIQFAKTKGLGDAAEEVLFKAYFTEGKNIADHSVLVALGESIGLDKKETAEVIAGTAFTKEVKADGQVAQRIGINGVPFFVIENKYGISGAQPSELFLEALETSWKESQPAIEIISSNNNEGTVCSTDGECI
jgi:protein disulfide-isomerase